MAGAAERCGKTGGGKAQGARDISEIHLAKSFAHLGDLFDGSRRISSFISANCFVNLGEFFCSSRRISYQAREDELRAERRRASDALHAAAGARER